MRGGISLCAVLVLSVAMFAIPAGSANAGRVVDVVSYTGSNNWNNYGGNMSDLFSGEEITKVDPLDPATWTAGGGAYTSEWQAAKLLSGAANNKIAWTAFDFGDTVSDLENIYFWNIRQGSGGNAQTLTYNMYYATSPTVAMPVAPTSSSSAVDYDFSSAGWILLNGGGVLTMPQRGSEPDPADQVISLGGISARHIGVEIITNRGSTSRAGLSEVAVTELVPTMT